MSSSKTCICAPEHTSLGPCIGAPKNTAPSSPTRLPIYMLCLLPRASRSWCCWAVLWACARLEYEPGAHASALLRTTWAAALEEEAVFRVRPCVHGALGRLCREGVQARVAALCCCCSHACTAPCVHDMTVHAFGSVHGTTSGWRRCIRFVEHTKRPKP